MPRPAEPDPPLPRDRYGPRPEGPAPGTAPPAPGHRRSAGGGSRASIPLPRPPGPVAPGPWEAPVKPRRDPRRDLEAAGLTEEVLVSRRDTEPPPGWRRWVYWWSGRLIDPGPGGDELARRALLHRIRRPLIATHRIAVISIKGGVGKTTVAACLGLVLAEHRGDRVVALDANPNAGTLADRLTGEPIVTVRELLRDLDRIGSWTDMSRYTSLAERLQVVASEQDPASGDAFGRDEYERINAVLGRFFNLTVTDSGTGLVHSTMVGTLRLADSLIVVGEPTVDGASRAAKTLDWLIAHGHAALAAEALVVLSHDRVSLDVDRARVHDYFTTRCRAVVDIPHDRHLATGGRIELGRLHPRTRDAFLQLAALVTDRFAPTPGAPAAGRPAGPAAVPAPTGYRGPVRPVRAPGEQVAGGPTLEA